MVLSPIQQTVQAVLIKAIREPLMSANLRRFLTTFCFLFAAQLGHAQEAMDNSAVLKLSASGLSETLIVQTINATPGHYDTTTDALIALKQAGLTDKEVGAMLIKNAGLLVSAPAVASTDSTASAPATPPDPTAKPRIFLQSESHGPNLNSRRNQSMEMSKDFEKNCPAVRISINQTLADYTVVLNHVEADFSRDNQIQIADKNGDLISKTKEGGTIKGDVKKACVSILADWTKKTTPPSPTPPTTSNPPTPSAPAQ
jgi:hypothetical protein